MDICPFPTRSVSGVAGWLISGKWNYSHGSTWPSYHPTFPFVKATVGCILLACSWREEEESSLLDCLPFLQQFTKRKLAIDLGKCIGKAAPNCGSSCRLVKGQFLGQFQASCSQPCLFLCNADQFQAASTLPRSLFKMISQWHSAIVLGTGISILREGILLPSEWQQTFSHFLISLLSNHAFFSCCCI